MRKVDPTVIKETLYIAVGTLILSVIMQAVFVIIRQWDYTVLLGNLMSWAAGVLNFFLMGLTVQKSVGQEPKQAATTMRLSQMGRLLFMFVIAMLGALLPCFNIWATLIPILFPRIIIFIRGLLIKKEGARSGGNDEKE